MCNSPLELLLLWVWARDDGCFLCNVTLRRTEAIGVEVFQRLVEDRSDCTDSHHLLSHSFCI